MPRVLLAFVLAMASCATSEAATTTKIEATEPVEECIDFPSTAFRVNCPITDITVIAGCVQTTTTSCATPRVRREGPYWRACWPGNKHGELFIKYVVKNQAQLTLPWVARPGK